MPISKTQIVDKVNVMQTKIDENKEKMRRMEIENSISQGIIDEYNLLIKQIEDENKEIMKKRKKITPPDDLTWPTEKETTPDVSTPQV